MAEPVWEPYYTLTVNYSSVNLDFTNYRYLLNNSGPANLTLESEGHRDPLYISPKSTIELTLGMLNLIQGENFLRSYYGGFLRIERLLLWTPPNLKLNTNGAVKEFDKGWVNINGQLKEIDKMWTKVDGVLKEI